MATEAGPVGELMARLAALEARTAGEIGALQGRLRAAEARVAAAEGRTVAPVQAGSARGGTGLRAGRRALLRTAGASAAAFAALGVLAARDQLAGSTPGAAAADGDNLKLGQANAASTPTGLAPVGGVAPDPLLLVDNGAGGGRGVVAAGAAETAGLDASAAGATGYGVHGTSDQGYGVVGDTLSGIDLYAAGTGRLAQYPTAATGAPTGGSYAAGEQLRDAAGNLYLCLAGGTPGTWKRVLVDGDATSSVQVTAPLVNTGTPAAPVLGIAPATPAAPGSLSAADKQKLDAYPATPPTTGGGHVLQDEGTPVAQRPTLNVVGPGVQVRDSAATTSSILEVFAASPTQDGTMSAADKGKLDGIAAGAQANTLVSVSGVAPITVGAVDAAKNQAIAIQAASPTVPGAMSATDKAKLDDATPAATASTIVRRDTTNGAALKGFDSALVTTWATPLFGNNWQSEPTSQPVQYRRDALGFVHIRGTAYKTSGTPVDNEVMFTLPVGFRSTVSKPEIYSTATDTGLGRINVTPAGTVTWRQGGYAGFHGLSGITFEATVP